MRQEDAVTTNGSRPPVIDAVQYIVEPPGLWVDRVAANHRDAVPRVVPMPDRGEGWSFDGGAWLRPLGLEVEAGRGPLDVRGHGHAYGDIRPGMHDARARLEDMRLDGVDAACIYPTYGLELRTLGDPELQVACVRAYNDAVWEWAHEAGAGRLVPQALLPAIGLAESVAELDRVAALGFRGVVFTGWPSAADRPSPDDDQLWARCQEAGIVVNLLRGGPSADRTPVAPRRYIGDGGANGADRVRALDVPQPLRWTHEASTNNTNLSWLILTGVLDRFPDLRVVLAEAGAGWLPTCGELLDWNYRYAQFLAFARLRLRPSDYIRRQVWTTLRGERWAVESRRGIGVESIMWSSGYPASTSSWPNSTRSRSDLFAGVPEHERVLMSGGNCAELYGLQVEQVAAAPLDA
jgi:predicted TIM-barrel fold metal-dependent hydrolase